MSSQKPSDAKESSACVLCLEAMKALGYPKCGQCVSQGDPYGILPTKPGVKDSDIPTSACFQGVMMIQTLTYIHGMHELLYKSLCVALNERVSSSGSNFVISVHESRFARKARLPNQFLCMAPRELQDIIGRLSMSNQTDTTTTLLRSTNSLKKFVTLATREANKSRMLKGENTLILKEDRQHLLPGTSTSDRVLAVLLFLWGHHCQDLDSERQLKQKATTLGIPLSRLKMAKNWYTLVCAYPGILSINLQNHVLWENARDLYLLLQDLSATEEYKPKIAALKSQGHMCFESFAVSGHACACAKQ